MKSHAKTLALLSIGAAIGAIGENYRIRISHAELPEEFTIQHHDPAPAPILPGVTRAYLVKSVRDDGLHKKYLAEKFPDGGAPDMPIIASPDLGSDFISGLLSKHCNSTISPQPWVVSMSGVVLTNDNDAALYLVEFELIHGAIAIYSADTEFCRSDNDSPEFYYRGLLKLCEFSNYQATKKFLSQLTRYAPEETGRASAAMKEFLGPEDPDLKEIKQILEQK